VLAGLGPLAPGPDRRPTRPAAATESRAPRRTAERKRPAPPQLPLDADVNGADLLGRLCERLGPEPLLVDELIRQCQASTAEVQRALMELELDGRLERHPGNRVSLAAS
jgi:DNA processing protein